MEREKRRGNMCVRNVQGRGRECMVEKVLEEDEEVGKGMDEKIGRVEEEGE